MQRPQSLILVTVDCLRADHVGFLGYDRSTTPFLDSLASESIVFENAIAAGTPTYYAFPAIMASRYPLALGRDVVGLAPSEPTLASTLQEAGYATAAFLAGNPYLSPKFGHGQGFDVFKDLLTPDDNSVADDIEGPKKSSDAKSSSVKKQLNQSLSKLCHQFGPTGALYDELYFQYCQRSVAERSLDALRRFPSADVLVKEAADWLFTLGSKPFFLWLHFMDPHSPYYPRSESLELLGNQEATPLRAQYLNSYWNRSDAARFKRHKEELIGLYDAGIRWVDLQVQCLVENLQKLNLWQNCIFALTADHGEEFLDHGGRYHAPSKLSEELIHVPLLLRANATANRVQAPFSLLHLAPTLLDSLNTFVPADFRGQSFWQKLQKRESWDGTAITECVADCTNPFREEARLGGRILSVREQRYKLVVDFSSGEEHLFDLQSDPAESKPLAMNVGQDVRKRLLKQALKHIHSSVESRNFDARFSARLNDIQFSLSCQNMEGKSTAVRTEKQQLAPA